jgi:transposase
MLQKALIASAKSDSVAQMRFAAEAGDDGAAQPLSFCLEEAVPDDHPVRGITAVLDLSWVHSELAPYYPRIGRPSIDPVLMIRMLIIGYVFAIRLERAC